MKGLPGGKTNKPQDNAACISSDSTHFVRQKIKYNIKT